MNVRINNKKDYNKKETSEYLFRYVYNVKNTVNEKKQIVEQKK